MRLPFGFYSNNFRDTASDGKQLFLVIGDSIARGSAIDGVGPTIGATQAYGTVDGITLTQITNDDINPTLGFAPGSIGSQYPQFCTNYIANNPGKKPVIICRGLPGSTVFTGGTGTWNDNSLYGPAVTAVNNAMNTVGVNKLKGIFIILGINDTGLVTSLSSIQSAINSLVSRLTTSFPNTDIVIGQIGKLAVSNVDPRLTAIRGYWKSTVSNNTNVNFAGHLGSFEANSLYNPDGLHPNISGCNSLGQMWAEWFQNSTYTKFSRAIISSHFDILSGSRKTEIQNAITALGASYTDADAFYYWHTSNVKNQYLDWAFLQNATPQGGNQANFTVNDCITSTATKVFGTGLDGSITTLNSAIADRYFVVKVKTNTVGAGTLGSIMGTTNGTTSYCLLDQFTSPSNRVRGGVNVNFTTTGNVVLYGGETAFSNNSLYGVSAQGGTQTGYKNGNILGATAPQGTSPVACPTEVKIGTFTGSGGNLLSSYQYYIDGKASTADQLAIYNAMETLINNW